MSVTGLVTGSHPTGHRVTGRPEPIRAPGLGGSQPQARPGCSDLASCPKSLKQNITSNYIYIYIYLCTHIMTGLETGSHPSGHRVS